MDATRNAVAGAAQNQLSGRALPSLILGHWRDASDHARADAHCKPTADLINVALSHNAKLFLFICAQKPEIILEKRKSPMKLLLETEDKIDPQSRAWKATLPENSPDAWINFDLIFLLISVLYYPDTALVRDLARGIPIAGPIPTTPGLTVRNTPKCLIENGRDISKRNAEDYERVLKSRGAELSQKMLGKTLKEVDAGWVTPPTDVSDTALRTVPLTPGARLWSSTGMLKRKLGR